MPYFVDDVDAYKYLAGVWRVAAEHPEVGPKLAAAGISLQLQYSDTACQTTIRLVDPLEVVEGDTDIVPDVTLTLSADDANLYWRGDLNLAVALAQETGKRVALVDLDLQFGDIGVLLNLDYSRSITDLVESAGNLDADALNDVLASGPGGVRVLLAPISPELADLVNADLVRSVMAELRRSCDYVVVDTSAHLGEVTLEVIESANRVIVVTALTIPAIKDAKLTLKVLESLNVAEESVVLVVNRNDAHSDVDRERIEQNLRRPVAAHLPFDSKVLSDAVNRGTPFVTSQPDSEISQAIRQLVSHLVPTAAGGQQGERKKPRRFGFGGR